MADPTNKVPSGPNDPTNKALSEPNDSTSRQMQRNREVPLDPAKKAPLSDPYSRSRVVNEIHWIRDAIRDHRIRWRELVARLDECRTNAKFADCLTLGVLKDLDDLAGDLGVVLTEPGPNVVRHREPAELSRDPRAAKRTDRETGLAPDQAEHLRQGESQLGGVVGKETSGRAATPQEDHTTRDAQVGESDGRRAELASRPESAGGRASATAPTAPKRKPTIE